MILLLLGIFIGIVIYLYIGWITVKKHNGKILTGGVAGLLGGLLTGLIASIINSTKAIIVVFSQLPDVAAGYGEVYLVGAILGVLFMSAAFISVGLIMGFILGVIGAVLAGARD